MESLTEEDILRTVNTNNISNIFLKEKNFKVSVFIYKVNHKGWDCKDDLNLFEYDVFRIILSILLYIFFSLFMIGQGKKQIYSYMES